MGDGLQRGRRPGDLRGDVRAPPDRSRGDVVVVEVLGPRHRTAEVVVATPLGEQDRRRLTLRVAHVARERPGEPCSEGKDEAGRRGQYPTEPVRAAVVAGPPAEKHGSPPPRRWDLGPGKRMVSGTTPRRETRAPRSSERLWRARRGRA